MVKCINIVKCPVCGRIPKMFIYTIGPAAEMACTWCEKSYGCIVEYRNDVSDDTQRMACQIWQQGACDQIGIEEIQCEFHEM